MSSTASKINVEQAPRQLALHRGSSLPQAVTELKEYRGKVIEWVDEKGLCYSAGPKLYRRDFGQSPQVVGSFPVKGVRSILSNFHLGRRLSRSTYYNVIKLDNNVYFVSYDRSLGFFENGEFLAVDNLERNARFLRSGCASHSDGGIYMGEYIPNQNRGAISVYRVDSIDRKVNEVYRFQPGSIRHVHGVYKDPFSDDIWVATGDIGDECKLLRTSNCFKDIEVIGSGDETWRAVSLVFTKNAIFYGTDAEFIPNQIFKIERGSMNRSSLGEIDSTVFYSRAINDDLLFFGSTAELCPSNSSKTASIWCVLNQEEIFPLVSFDKDRFHHIYFQFGHYLFPHAESKISADFYFSAWGLKNADARTYRIKLDELTGLL